MKRWMTLLLGVIVLVATSAPGYAYDAKAITSKVDVIVTNSATLVLASNAFRAALSCTNTNASVHVRWGDASVTASQGQQFRAGTSIEIPNPAAVYMISEGANVTVSCTEETR